MRMPFGKYKGITLQHLPDSYVWWLYGQDLSGDLADAVQQEAFCRWPDKFELYYRHTPAPITDKLKQIYRELCKMFHPDCGGNLEAQKAINLFYERLCQ